MANIVPIQDVKTQYFDHCFIALGLIENDSRTLNIIRTLSNLSDDILSSYDVTIIPVEKYNDRRFLTLWIDFFKAVFPLTHKIKAGIYWSQDLYILPFVTFIAKVNGGRLNYDAREVYTALGTVHDEPFKQRFVSIIERYLIHKVNLTYTSGHLDSAYLRDLYNIPRPDVVMNLPPYQEVEKANKIRSYFQLEKDKQIILYQGLLGKGRGLLKIIRTLPYLDNVVLCLIGHGRYLDTIIKEAKRLDVENKLLMMDRVPYNELMPWTTSADLGLAFIEPVSLSYQFALPNKLFEYCMAGIPSLVSDLPAMRPVLQEYKIGRLVSPNAGPKELALHIRELLDNDEKIEFSKNCKKASKYFNWERQEETILKLAGLHS
jgi:glycosyltransferase involved in cell wall biosynthesis